MSASPGTAAELVSGRTALGDDNRHAVLEVLQGSAWSLGTEEVLDGLPRRGSPLGRATVRRHLAALVKSAAAIRTGSGSRTVYLAPQESESSAQGPSERQNEVSRWISAP